MARPSETHTVVWQEIPVTVTYEADWLGLCAHLQIRAGEKLPVTETGYKSLYLSAEAVATKGGAIAFVRGLLDEAANSAPWQRYCQERQQLSLF